MISRTRLVYGLLLAVWGLIVTWQVVEHDRVKASARAALINRSRDITTTLGLVIRSQRRFGVSIVSQERMESALKELVKPGDHNSNSAPAVASKSAKEVETFTSREPIAIALLNASGEVVASAGGPIDLETKGMMQKGEHWEEHRVVLVNLIDLGAPYSPEGTNNQRTIILPPRVGPRGPRPEGTTNGPGGWTNFVDGTNLGAFPNFRMAKGTNAGPATNTTSLPGESNALTQAATNQETNATLPGTTGSNVAQAGPPSERPPGERRPRLGRPPWMSEPEYKSLLETRGLHGVIIAMSTENFRRASAQDLWIRFLICCFAGLSVGGLGLAWRNVSKSSELQMRLLRASELNSHLKQMNLAAAGLAHETRNPLNIIRGLAQMVSKQEDTSPEIRKKVRDILDETDRVTAQLNEFINYSRPREVRRSVVAASSLIGEVVRALSYDIDEKKIHLEKTGEELTIEADEQLLRQALSNLLLNATQAVTAHGEIRVAVQSEENGEASIEIIDNGPGVAEHQRLEIFKPYFTTHA